MAEASRGMLYSRDMQNALFGEFRRSMPIPVGGTSKETSIRYIAPNDAESDTIQPGFYYQNSTIESYIAGYERVESYPSYSAGAGGYGTTSYASVRVEPIIRNRIVSRPEAYGGWTTVVMPKFPNYAPRPFNQNYNLSYGYSKYFFSGSNSHITTLTAPTINELNGTESQMRVVFTDTNSYGEGEESVYAVETNGKFMGLASAIPNTEGQYANQANSKRMHLNGFVDNANYDIRIAAIRFKFQPYPESQQVQSNFSDTFTATIIPPQTPKQQSATLNSSNPLQSPSVGAGALNAIDVVRIPSEIFKKLGGHSIGMGSYNKMNPSEEPFITAGTVGQPNIINPRPSIFYKNTPIKMGLYRAVAKLKARRIREPRDYTTAGFVDWTIEDIQVNVEKPHTTNLMQTPADLTLQQQFNQDNNARFYDLTYDDQGEPVYRNPNSFEIGNGNPNAIGPVDMSDEMRDAWNNILLTEYYLGLPYLKENIKKIIKSKILSIFKDTVECGRILKDVKSKCKSVDNFTYEMPFLGGICLNFKSLIVPEKENVINYSLYDNQGKKIKSGQGAGVAIFADLQSSASFSLYYPNELIANEQLNESVPIPEIFTQ